MIYYDRPTMGHFGPLIDAYTIPQSVADGATVPIMYEARLPDLNIQGPATLDKLATIPPPAQLIFRISVLPLSIMRERVEELPRVVTAL